MKVEVEAVSLATRPIFGSKPGLEVPGQPPGKIWQKKAKLPVKREEPRYLTRGVRAMSKITWGTRG